MADSHTQQSGGQNGEEAVRLHEEAQRHYDRGAYAEARAVFERALALRRATLGDDDLATVSTLGALALVLVQQGDPAGAQPMIEHVLAVRERLLGPDHPDTAEAINNLGVIRRMQGDNETARSLYERALAIRERTLGPDDPLVGSTLSNLGVLLAARRDYSAARQCHERALAIHERALGPDDPKTARALNNLAAVLADQGDREAALPVLRRALAIHERALGAMHPSVANVLSNIADLYNLQGDHAAARPLYERALIIRERALGAGHPRTAETVRHLVGVLGSMGDFAQGIPLNRISQALRRSAGHPDARTVEALHRFVDRLEAEANRPLSPASQQALAEARSLEQQANTRLSAYDYAGAQAALERALALREGALRPDDLEQVPLLRKLGAALRAQGAYERLRPLQERIVEIHTRVLGDDHPMTLRARAELMSMQVEEEGFPEAWPALEQMQTALQGQVALNPDHPLAETIQSTGTMMEQLKALWEQVERARERPSGEQTPQPATPPLSDAEAEALLAGLDAVPWRALQHAYGPATDVPGHLRALLSADEHARERARRHLYETILHQGTVYEATAYVVPFVIKLLADAGTPDRPQVLQMLAALAEDDGAGGQQDEARWARAAHDAVGAGLPLYLNLLEAGNARELRGVAIAAVAAFPDRSTLSVPRLQAALAAEEDPLVRVWLLRALGRVMDARAASQAYFEDALARTEDPLLAFVAAGALAERAGEATPERAVEALVAATGTTAGVSESDGIAGIREMMASLQSAEAVEWVGTVQLAVQRLLELGVTRATPALLRAFQRTRTGDTARTVAEVLLDLTFNEGQVQSKDTAISQGPDGRRRVQYRHVPRQPERAPATLSAEQRAVLQALAAHEPFWRQDHDLLALYGLPAARADLRALLDA